MRTLSYGRQDHWDFRRSDSMLFGTAVEGLPYSMNLAGPDGGHYHVWFYAKPSEQDKQEVLSTLRHNWDVVSWSWSVLTQEQMREWERRRTGGNPDRLNS